MSKVFFTNSKDSFNKNKYFSLSNGFKRFSLYESDSSNIIAYKKLKVNNDNFFLIKDDYIATAGTYLYKQTLNQETLKDIYNDFDEDINEIRKNLIGNYIFIIKKGNFAYIFCDENNIFNSYYFYNRGFWAVSNNLYDIANACDLELKVNKNNLYIEVFQHTLLNGDTIYEECRKLLGSQFIRINLLNHFLEIFQISRVSSINFDHVKKFEESLSNLSNSIISKANIIGSNFKNVGVSMTGGLDSRTILAAFLRNGINPHLLYGVGNSALTNTKAEDLEINYIYKNKFNLKLTVLDWQTSEFPNSSLDKHVSKYGFLGLLYGSSEHFFSSFENLNDVEFIEFGYFGETLRNVDWIETMKGEFFTLHEFINFFYFNSAVESFLESQELQSYKAKILNDFNIICDAYGLDVNNISKNQFQILHNEYRKGADTAMVNFINYNFYSFSLLSLDEVENKILRLQNIWKSDGSFMIRLLKDIYSPILDVPCFSHTQKYLIDIRNNKIQNLHEKSPSVRLINFIKSFLKIKIVHKSVKHIYNYFKRSEYRMSNKYLKNFFIKDFSTFSDDDLRIKNFDGDIRFIAKYVQIVKILNRSK